jgi:Tfp pilus assembly pilus retraction ATPase PilT
VRENKLQHIDNQIQLGAKFGMQTMNQALVALVQSGLVNEEEAFYASPDKDDFRKCLQQ